LVAYTPAVAAALPDVQGHIQLAIDETNKSYRNSNVNLTAALVDSFEVDYKERSLFFDLRAFRENGDGRMDRVHYRRAQSAADVAVLLVDNSDYCGLASAIYADSSRAFAVVYYVCATGIYSLAHEIGHLQGCRHNPEADSANIPFAYGHGYHHYAGQWLTVMARRCMNCRRIPFWSNPNMQYRGATMGTKRRHDNVRVLNQGWP
jgi:hypothetical protein